MKQYKEDQHKARVENTVWVQRRGGMKITNRMGIKIRINKDVCVCVVIERRFKLQTLCSVCDRRVNGNGTILG